jgi:hypothetical protein
MEHDAHDHDQASDGLLPGERHPHRMLGLLAVPPDTRDREAGEPIGLFAVEPPHGSLQSKLKLPFESTVTKSLLAS